MSRIEFTRESFVGWLVSWLVGWLVAGWLVGIFEFHIECVHHLRRNLSYYITTDIMAQRNISTVSSNQSEQGEAATEPQQLHAGEQQLLKLQSELKTVHAELENAQEVAGAHAQSVVDTEQQNATLIGELKACHEELKSIKAELKIFKECVESQGERVIEAETKISDEKHLREAVERRLQNILKLINSVGAIHWERARTQSSFDADSWRTWCQRIEEALEPLISQSGV
jgi:chromosome segregation ATPase